LIKKGYPEPLSRENLAKHKGQWISAAREMFGEHIANIPSPSLPPVPETPLTLNETQLEEKENCT
jgi:hypothetical protein